MVCTVINVIRTRICLSLGKWSFSSRSLTVVQVCEFDSIINDFSYHFLPQSTRNLLSWLWNKWALQVQNWRVHFHALHTPGWEQLYLQFSFSVEKKANRRSQKKTGNKMKNRKIFVLFHSKFAPVVFFAYPHNLQFAEYLNKLNACRIVDAKTDAGLGRFQATQ